VIKKLALFSCLSLCNIVYSVFTEEQKFILITKYINLEALVSVLSDLEKVFFKKESNPPLVCHDLNDVKKLMNRYQNIHESYQKSNWADVYQFAHIGRWQSNINSIFNDPYKLQNDQEIIENLNVFYINGGLFEGMLKQILQTKEMLDKTKNTNFKMYIGIKANRKPLYSKENVNDILSTIQKYLARTLTDDEIAFIQKNSNDEEGFAKILVTLFQKELPVEIFYHNPDVYIKDLSEFFNAMCSETTQKINIGMSGRGRFFTFQVAVKVAIDEYLEKIKHINYNVYFFGTNNKEIISDEKALNQMIKMSLYLIDIILKA
jgi:hypothetical protein